MLLPCVLGVLSAGNLLVIVLQADCSDRNLCLKRKGLRLCQHHVFEPLRSGLRGYRPLSDSPA